MGIAVPDVVRRRFPEASRVYIYKGKVRAHKRDAKEKKKTQESLQARMPE